MARDSSGSQGSRSYDALTHTRTNQDSNTRFRKFTWLLVAGCRSFETERLSEDTPLKVCACVLVPKDSARLCVVAVVVVVVVVAAAAPAVAFFFFLFFFFVGFFSLPLYSLFIDWLVD